MRSFFPINGATKSLAASSSSGSVPFDATSLPSGEFQVRVYNSGTDAAAIRFDVSGQTITFAGNVPIPGGAVEVITVTNPQNAPITHAYAITASGTPTLYFTPGHGI